MMSVAYATERLKQWRATGRQRDIVRSQYYDMRVSPAIGCIDEYTATDGIQATGRIKIDSGTIEFWNTPTFRKPSV